MSLREILARAENAQAIEVLAYVRDFELTRKEEEMICPAWNVPIKEQITAGDDKALLRRSIALRTTAAEH